MGMKEDNDASIDAMKAQTDTIFPPLPSTRLSSTNVKTGFDEVYGEMKVINDRTSDAYAGLQSTIATISSAMGGKADSSAVSAAIASLTSALGGKADSSTVSAISTDLAKKPFIYFNGTQQTAPKMWLGSAVVSGGNAVFYLTDTGAVGGNAIFTNSSIFVQPILYAANAPPAFAPLTLSGDRKTLSIPVSKATTGISLLSVNLLGANAPANGDTVSIWVVGT